MAARSKARVCSRSLAGICGFESRWGHGYLSLVTVVCFQVEVCGTSRSLVQRSLTKCGVSECDREASIMRLWPTKDCSAIEKGAASSGWTPCRRSLNNNSRPGERSGKSTVVLRNFNLRRSQVRWGGEDVFEPVLNVHTPLFITFTQLYYVPSLQFSSQKKIILK